MRFRISSLEAKVSAGNFVLGLMALLLGYEYFTSRYLSRYPDYRLSLLIAGATVAYFLVLRFISYRHRRSMEILPSAALSGVDLLAAIGVVGLALEYGNYPAAFLLNVSPALYSFVPPGSIPAYALSTAFAFFIMPRAALHFSLPAAPQPAVAPQVVVKSVPGKLEDLVVALEETIGRLRSESESENPVVDPRNAQLLARLVRIVEALRLLWPDLRVEGLRITDEVPPMVISPSALRRERKSRWTNLIVLGLEPSVTIENEALSNVLVANPWANVLAQRALRANVERRPS